MEKPDWFKKHEEDDRRNFGIILEKLECIERKIDPVIEVYQTATTLGRWTKVLGSFILMCLGIWAAVKGLGLKP